MDTKLIFLNELLSELRINSAFKVVELSEKVGSGKGNAEPKSASTSNNKLLVCLSEFIVDMYSTIDGETFDDSSIIFHHPINEDIARVRNEQGKPRPFIELTEEQLLTESGIPRLSNFHQNIRHLPVKETVVCKIRAVSLLTLLQQSGYQIDRVTLDEDEDFFRLLRSPLLLDNSKILVPTSTVNRLSELLWDTAMIAFDADQQRRQSLNLTGWLEATLKSKRAGSDPFLAVLIAWSIANNRFPLLSELKSVFQSLYGKHSENKRLIGLGDDAEDLNYIKPFELFQANERVAKIYMKNLISYCFKNIS